MNETPNPDPDPGPAAAPVDTPVPVREGGAAGELLKQLFPALFGGAPKPIKLRIQSDIEARAPGRFTRQALTAFLRRHTGTTAYLNALLRASQRFDLDGQPAGELSAEHRAAAEQALQERRERLRQREAEMEAARRWRADLLRDWGRTSFSRANFCALKGVAESALDALIEQAKLEASQPPAQEPAPRRDARPPRRDQRAKKGGKPG